MPHSTASTPSHQSVSAYDDAARVAEYDAKMEIMHPNRAKIEKRYQYLRQLGIQKRWRERGEEKSLAAIAAELVELEKKDGDQPLPLDTDLCLLKEAGFRGVDCFWKETREAVWRGIK